MMQTQNPWTSHETASSSNQALHDDANSTSGLYCSPEWPERYYIQQDDPLLVVTDDEEKWSVRYVNPVTLCQAPRPAKCIGLPSQIENSELDTQFIIHPILTYDPFRPRLRFDMSLAPVEPRVGCFGEAATYPSLPSLTIVIPSLPWVLVVHHSLVHYVTVGDVLNTLWAMLQTPLDDEMRTEGRRRRIDLLPNGKHRFMGLSLYNCMDESFMLHYS